MRCKKHNERPKVRVLPIPGDFKRVKGLEIAAGRIPKLFTYFKDEMIFCFPQVEMEFDMMRSTGDPIKFNCIH